MTSHRSGKMTKSQRAVLGLKGSLPVFVGWDCEDGEDGRVWVVEGDRADSAELLEVVSVRVEVAVPGDHVEWGEAHLAGEKFPREFVDHLFKLKMKLLCILRLSPRTRLKGPRNLSGWPSNWLQSVLIVIFGNTKIRQSEPSFEHFTNPASGSLRDIHTEPNSSRHHHYGLRRDLQPPELTRHI